MIARSYSMFVCMKCLPGPRQVIVILNSTCRNLVFSFVRLVPFDYTTFDFPDPAGSLFRLSLSLIPHSHARIPATRTLLTKLPVPAVCVRPSI